MAALRKSSGTWGYGIDATYVEQGQASTSLPNASIYVGAEDNGGVWKPCTATLGGASIGSAVATSQAEWDTFRADWDTFENTLGRKAP